LRHSFMTNYFKYNLLQDNGQFWPCLESQLINYFIFWNQVNPAVKNVKIKKKITNKVFMLKRNGYTHIFKEDQCYWGNNFAWLTVYFTSFNRIFIPIPSQMLQGNNFVRIITYFTSFNGMFISTSSQILLRK